MKVLVACEFSGVVRDAFIARGHYAYSCDLEASESSMIDRHYQCDVRKVLDMNWDLMIGHPPCTRICNSGVSWLAKRNLWQDMRDGAAFFKMLLDCDIPKIAIENPIPHKYALDIIGKKYDQIVQPWQFGHGETKATCLWLKGLPKLGPGIIVSGREQRLHRLPPGPNRSKERSRTYPGIAAAMAEQWGEL